MDANTAEKVKDALVIEFLGIHIEDVKYEKNEYGFETKIIYMFSVPEKSELDIGKAKYEIEDGDDIYTADGLIKIAKEFYTDVIIDSFGDDDADLLEDFKKDMSEYVKFYAKVRKGEVWNNDLANKRIQELTRELEAACEYKEV